MIRRAFLAALLAVFVVLVPALPAQADNSAPITRYDVDVHLRADGVAEVVMEFDMDFAQYRGRGPILQFSTKQYKDSSQQEWYSFDYSRPRVSSPTGARTDLGVDESDRAVVWRIGNENTWYRDRQTYRVEFTLRGIVSPDVQKSGMDEFNWNVFSGNASRIENLTVTVDGPVPAEQAACYTGTGSSTPCPAEVRDGKAVVEVGTLNSGRPLQVVAGFPVGTFPGVTQDLSRVPTLMSNLTPGPVGYGLAGGLGLAALAGSAVLVRRNKRDLVYLGLTPGTLPPRGEEDSTKIGYVDPKKVPVAVQFHPPKDATPGEVGTLIDATADGIDVSATIVDLAVRGYIRIHPHGGRSEDFTMFRLDKDDADLEPFERSLLRDIFRGNRKRNMEQLRDKKFHGVMSEARSSLYRQMVRKRWFVSNPEQAGLGLYMMAFFSALLGAGVGVILWGKSLALIAVPFFILAIGLAIAAANAHKRTPQGSAMLAQSRGFELYLRTAEANQIKFEEGIDVFSRYLPYAMVFGVADRWAKIFEDLAAAGQYQADTTWLATDRAFSYYYVGSMMSNFSNSFSSSMSAAAADYSAAQASSASSGGSGFSGGGGFGGGSVGSW